MSEATPTASMMAHRYAAVSMILRRNLPRELAKMRALKGLSLDAAADQMGLSRSTLWRVEAGQDVRQWCLITVLDWMAKQS